MIILAFALSTERESIQTNLYLIEAPTMRLAVNVLLVLHTWTDGAECVRVEFCGCRYLQGSWLQHQLLIAPLRDVVLECAALIGYSIEGSSATMGRLWDQKHNNVHDFLLTNDDGTVFFFELTAYDAHLPTTM